jgi:hypothetical protein
MKLHEVEPTIISILEAADTLKDLPLFYGSLKSQKKEFEQAMDETGLALVVIQESGEPAQSGAVDLYLNNILIVSVVENVSTNETGYVALEIVGKVLKAINQYDWPGRGLKNVLTVDNPAYTKADLDTGLLTYFCNFKIKSIE